MAKLPYQEGTWFAVPLGSSAYAVGVVARATRRGRVILSYFFGPRRSSIPKAADLASLRPKDACRVLRNGDLGLLDGSWPIIGTCQNWVRADWPVPPFHRVEPIVDRIWLVYYDDMDPNHLLREERVPSVPPDVPQDGMYGSGAVEAVLRKELG